jgi:hypothetical protein
MAAHSAALALEVAAKSEPKVRAALERALRLLADSVSVSAIEAYITGGDLSGLAEYLNAKFGSQAAAIIGALDEAVVAAGAAAAKDIETHLKGVGIKSPQLLVTEPGVPAQIVWQGIDDRFSYNPSNLKTIAAVRQWQGQLIQQMTEAQRAKIMDQIRDGLLRGDNPRAMAVRIREGLPLTAGQTKAVEHFADDLDRIVANGLRSAQSWGVFTPRQIAQLKAENPSVFRRLNFAPEEIKGGRRWAKISRAQGTLAYDPVAGLKPSKPLGFVAPPGTQGGPSAYRIGPDGRLIDNMTSWRLRDKRFDPLIYDVVATDEAARDAAEAMRAARTADEQAKAAKAVQNTEAAQAAARRALQAEQGRMVGRYRERYVKHRAETIARTESLRAANLGSFEAWRQAIEDSDLFDPSEVKRKWITARDDRVRPDHRGAAGQKRGLREPFTVGGIAVMFPPHQPNCRCTVGYAIDLSGGS